MSDTAIPVSHAPAMKVGGRRLSVSSSARHRTQAHAEPTTTAKEGGSAAEPKEPAMDDYPRPAPPTGENIPHQQHHEEEPPKKERNEKKFQDMAHRKVEMTRPTREFNTGNRGFGGGMRIAQPAGKALGV
ncbi:hypothetical protein D9613_004292 [Agrocybe pediades]|uniref:Uncharacterized protein n=1 Tax=Agrocybe pediades TaxID=84607 RepID=A0A8H4QJ90_9AGAR|nr:hypothetical protein D9613_004292 [Agrocybe pediades]